MGSPCFVGSRWYLELTNSNLELSKACFYLACQEILNRQAASFDQTSWAQLLDANLHL